jgi:ADYC domain-containing protein
MRQCILLLTLFSGACALADGDPDGEVAGRPQAVESTNGESLNGTSLNGTSLNGESLNGKSLNGTGIGGTSLNGTGITATSTTAPPLSGAAMIGSSWNSTVGSAQIKLRIDTALQGTGSNADLWFYGVSYQTTTGWRPLCGLDGAGVPIQAVTVAGWWTATARDSGYYGASPTMFTFACRGKSIAKCVELGYKTFKGLTPQLTSCVRLLRADFCGTGVSYTVDGTLLNLYDNVGVQADTDAWKLEAEWTPSGARCINSNNSSRYQLALTADPTCIKPLKTTTCGTSFASGAVLIDELP